jgi:hypothetical protein
MIRPPACRMIGETISHYRILEKLVFPSAKLVRPPL